MLGGNSGTQAQGASVELPSQESASTLHNGHDDSHPDAHAAVHSRNANSEPGAKQLKTLANKTGIGIHTGRIAQAVVVSGAEAGIHFSYAEPADAPPHQQTQFSCPALLERLSGTTRSTALVMRGQSRKKVQVSMIEHFMAAAHIWNLDNIEVQLSAPAAKSDANLEHVEVPVLDGSSLEWCTSLKATTLVAHERQVWVIAKSFAHVDGDRQIRFEPETEKNTGNNTFKNFYTHYAFEGNFGPEIFQKAQFSMNWIAPEESQLRFLQKVAPARTIGFLHEIEALRAQGLALGGSLDNALVIDGGRIVNPGGERIENELASHKLLDAVGDFALAGRPILGSIFLKSAGHALHLRSLKAAFEEGCLQPGYLRADGSLLVASV